MSQHDQDLYNTWVKAGGDVKAATQKLDKAKTQDLFNDASFKDGVVKSTQSQYNQDRNAYAKTMINLLQSHTIQFDWGGSIWDTLTGKDQGLVLNMVAKGNYTEDDINALQSLLQKDGHGNLKPDPNHTMSAQDIQNLNAYQQYAAQIPSERSNLIAAKKYRNTAIDAWRNKVGYQGLNPFSTGSRFGSPNNWWTIDTSKSGPDDSNG